MSAMVVFGVDLLAAAEYRISRIFCRRRKSADKYLSAAAEF